MAKETVRTEKQARSIAEAFCKEHPWNTNSRQIQGLIYPLDNPVTNELYIYSLDPAGFVIVSGDTRAHTILGYSFDNTLDIDEENVWSMIEAYQEQIKSLD
ncbi:Spi family protease inhibitor [Streptococcus halichoeri]|uniref:Spi family protease inhibitor n=1 Tax=Streptococcus halichoeri TaxID=254785 RepID=UPI00135AE922|nr:Spi family protease inhibitor [Streptococcus halichoeri]